MFFKIFTFSPKYIYIYIITFFNKLLLDRSIYVRMMGAVHDELNLAFNCSLSVIIKVVDRGIISEKFIHALRVNGLR